MNSESHATHLYTHSSLYFNTENYLVTFMHDWSQLKGNPELFIHFFQNTLNYFTFNSIQNLRDLYLNQAVQNFFQNNIFATYVNSRLVSPKGDTMYSISQGLYVSLKEKTELYYEINSLRTIFPEFREDLEMFEALSYDTDGTLYDVLSTPNVKLYYPEPFIATPSFAHEDLWILNILQYQHWLWFFFISLIMFYFITFINVVRWCNQRTKPKRETRGISRSKCADLITACVPVSWAASIVISESVDASDYYDGFGTGEVVIGIRAYQWGWEYFYPKGIDLNYTVNPNYAIFTGNSLKYINAGSKALESNMLWKYYQLNNIAPTSSTLTNTILNDNSPLNNMNFSSCGINTLQTSSAFNKIQFFSKIQNHNLFMPIVNFNTQYIKLIDLYYTDTALVNSSNYGTVRQHTFLSGLSNKNLININLDSTGLSKYFSYSQSKPPLNFAPNPFASILNFETPADNSFARRLFNFKVIYSFKDLKSVNKTLLPNERSVRLVDSAGRYNRQKGNFIGTNTVFPLDHNPLPTLKNLSFDYSFSEHFNPMLLQSKEESAPNFIFDTYWVTNWSFMGSNRLNPLWNYFRNLTGFYLPLITEYAEYDFKNWQIFELVEDSYWESTYSSPTNDEYLNILGSSQVPHLFPAESTLFNNLVRRFKFVNNKVIAEKNFGVSLPILATDYLPVSSLVNLNDFKQFQLEIIVDSFDDTYNSMKLNNYLLNSSYGNLINIDLWTTLTNSYAHILDTFTTSKDDNLWTKTLNSGTNLLLINSNSLNAHDIRLHNPLKLRSTTKNSIITYSAIQKVFKSRFDEGRSNARLLDISNSYNSYMFLSSKRAPYETLLSKNSNNFFLSNNYFSTFKNTINLLTPLMNNLNIYFTNLPFLISTQSDASRYLWFDWQARWSSIEVQPSSVARYSLLGIPYINKNFEYTTNIGDEINDSEIYLTRLSRARKNYMTTWAYTPLLYTRLLNWYQDKSLTKFLFNMNSLVNLKVLLLYAQNPHPEYGKRRATPSYSLYNTPGREAVQSLVDHTNFDANISILSDLLTKREYLYRIFLNTKSISLELPVQLVSTPANPLLIELKKTFTFVDPVSFSSEISRNFFYQNTNLIQLNFIDNCINKFYPTLPQWYHVCINNLFNNMRLRNLGVNNDFYKNQYRPMKKGVTNMIRLHATGAIALPIEIRLHILASSKDVIHSWAIPSAGIKIDCVPGFSSHRIAIFLVSGIYWGQCMEICGRFHHWMPIIIYFMKRDLFFLWCTHFQHFDTLTNSFTNASGISLTNNNNVSYTIKDWTTNYR